MKNILKSFVVAILGWQVRRLYKNNHFKTIGVVGSIGKTSTKSAIAQVLEKEYHVRYQQGNYNDIVSIPLVFFGESLPPLFNPLAWLLLLIRNEKALRRHFPFEVVVIELGTDGPGQIKQLKRYLKLDWAVVTAITPEHMENFADIEAVADEELSVQTYAEQLLINSDLCSSELLQKVEKPYQSYGKSIESDFLITAVTRDSWSINFPDKHKIAISKKTISDAEVYSLSAAAVIGRTLELKDEQITKGIMGVKQMPGRMSMLPGKKGSTIIDDTYNASPQATILALQTIYGYPAKFRIALLGNMNELGRQSEMLHRQVGRYCDPDKLGLVVTLGPEANKFLSEEAEKRGCKVIRTNTPEEAAEAIEQAIITDTVILAKGSQNGVFAEEAVKQLLENESDQKLLVRQSKSWLKKKQDSFRSG